MLIIVNIASEETHGEQRQRQRTAREGRQIKGTLQKSRNHPWGTEETTKATRTTEQHAADQQHSRTQIFVATRRKNARLSGARTWGGSGDVGPTEQIELTGKYGASTYHLWGHLAPTTYNIILIRT